MGGRERNACIKDKEGLALTTRLCFGYAYSIINGHEGKKMNDSFEFLWHFDDRDELEFWEWCRGNRSLIELLRQEKTLTIEDVINAKNRILDATGIMPENAFNHLITLATLTRLHAQREGCMYGPIAKALGGKVLGGASQPDCLVRNIPVEAKPIAFNRSALKQLTRYMRAAGSTRGIAAARVLNVQLPKNVFFLKVEFDRSQNEYVVKNAREAIDWLNES